MSLTNIINYTTSGDFTFDSNVVSFPGTNVQLKNIRPANSTFYQGFHVGFNGEYGNGSLTGTPVNGPVLTGSGAGPFYADFSGGSTRYIDYVGTGNSDFQQIGTIRFNYIPLYSGSPGTNQFMFGVSAGSGSGVNQIQLVHLSGGPIYVYIADSAGAQIMGYNAGPAFNPVSGTTYEFELNVNITAGATRLFIDGLLYGVTQTQTGTRSSSLAALRLGNTEPVVAGTSNFKMNNFIVFNAVQHTTNFASEIPRIAETLYSTTNPSVVVNAAQPMSGLLAFVETAVKPANTSVQYQLIIDGVYKYWNGSAWVISDGTYAQSNTASVVNANLGSLDLSMGANVKVAAILDSVLGNATPTLSSVEEDYNFFFPAPTAPAKCYVYCYLEDILGASVVTNAVLIAELPQPTLIGGFVIAAFKTSITFNSQGYAQLQLVSTTATSAKYNFSITYLDSFGIPRIVAFNSSTVPVASSISLTTLTTIVTY